MIFPEPQHAHTLDDYAAVASLSATVDALRRDAAPVAAELAGRRIWMVNSTAQGGGVAEMLPAMIALLRDLGIDAHWAVMQSGDAGFFHFTKRLHNLIHGAGTAEIGAAERELYEGVNRDNAEALVPHLAAGDVVAMHDPQPLAMASTLRGRVDVRTIWRCHIGIEEENAATRTAWEFMRPYTEAYDRAVFSAPEYTPRWLSPRTAIIHPGIDPLSPKNRELHLHKLVGVLVNAALVSAPGPVVRAPFPHLAERLQCDGSFRPAVLPEDIGLLSRPIVTQISRWDRLKGFLPLLRGFERMKQRMWESDVDHDVRARRRLDLVRLVLAGPDPRGVQDDPEAAEVLAELSDAYIHLDPMLQDDVAILVLPMAQPEENALMVNALQRASSIVAQNSLREGFGLTVTEAMWKRIPVLSNARAFGPRTQIRDGVDGRLAADPEDPAELARVLRDMLADTHARNAWGRAGQRRVHDSFLVFSQLRAWLELLAEVVRAGR